MQFLQLPSFGNTVAANGTASLVTAKLDNKSLHAVHFDIGGGNTRANMSRVQLRYAEKDIINLVAHPVGPISAGTLLQNLMTWRNANLGVAEGAGYLPVFLGNPEVPDYRQKHLGDLDMSVHRGTDNKAANFEIQVDLGAGVAPTMSAFAEVYAPKQALGQHPADQLVHKMYIRNYFTPSGAQPRQEYQLGIGAKAKAQIVNMFMFDAQLTSLEVDKDDVKLWQDIAVADAKALQARYGHVAVAGMDVWSPTMHGDLLDMVSTTKDGDRINPATFQFLFTVAAADSITALVEVIGDQYSPGNS